MRDAAHLKGRISPDDGKIAPGAMFYWLAFCRLTADRGCVAEPTTIPGPGNLPIVITQLRQLPIPWTAMDAYARRHHLDDEGFADFERIVGEMDQEYLAVMAEERSKKQPTESD